MFDPQRAADLQGPLYGVEPVPPEAFIAPALIDTGRLAFRALPADIEQLNRRAVDRGDVPVTALSLRCWADVADRYAITSCGGSFGEGFGPKLVARASDTRINCHNCVKPPGRTIAIPGRRTTAFLVLGMLLGERVLAQEGKFIEMPFDRITAAVAEGRADAGVVIHEDQLSFEDRGLRQVIDLGAWWRQVTGLPLPLGVNAVRRDLDAQHGPGTLDQVDGLLHRSVAVAMDQWDRSVDYTMAFARANALRSGAEPPSRERVERYCRMYVSPLTKEMGPAGREAIRAVLDRGAAMGLCPNPHVEPLTTT
ncbi:hypothetical protein J4558_08260 [Leptolyngbya sp. 15MV]|nr:hypothetical protein J4558_08260 [Leptolyngbya sp. 15MV]